MKSGVRDSNWSTETQSPGAFTFLNWPLFFVPFTRYGLFVIDPSLQQAHIGGRTLSIVLGN